MRMHLVMRVAARTLLVACALAPSLVVIRGARAADVRFPADARVVDVVAQYGATGDGTTDDTDAIQKALDDHAARGAIIYLPHGTYAISRTLTWPKGRSEGGFMKDTILQGQSEAGTVIRLRDAADGFGDPAKTKDMIYTGRAPAQRFRNAVRDLTIDAGLGNAGAVGLSFCANNQGCVRNVTLRSGPDGTAPGAVGLDMSAGEVGPQLVTDVTVIGFDVGVRTGSGVNSITLERIKLSGQRKTGYLNRENLSFIRGLTSRNAVPAVVNASRDAVVALIDSDLKGEGAAGGLPAMSNEGRNAQLFVRNVRTEGYAEAIRSGAEVVPVGTVAEWSSHAPVGLFATPLRTLGLEVKETPVIEWGDPAAWASPATFGGSPDDKEDDTAAIQAAIDSGAETVYLARGLRSKQANEHGAWFVSDTIVLRGNLRRLIGTEAVLKPTKALGDKPMFRLDDGAAPAVVVERMNVMDNRKADGKAGGVTFLHESKRALVIKNFSGAEGLRATGGGDVYAEDVVGNEWLIANGSRLWARQLNLEGSGMKLTNDGGQVWILGLKTEARGPILATRAGGRTEVIGAHLYTVVDKGQDRGAFFVEDAQLSVAGGAEYVWSRDWVTAVPLTATIGGETRTVTADELPRRGGGSMFALMIVAPSASSAASGTPPAAPKVSVADAAAGAVTLSLAPADPAVPVVGYRVTRDGKPVGNGRGEAFVDAGLTPQTTYQYEVVAYDGLNNESSPAVLAATTPADTTPPATPAKLRTGRVTDRKVSLDWNGSKDDIAMKGYELQRVGADGAVELTHELTALKYTDKSPVPGTKSTYRVTAIDQAGNRSTAAELAVPVPADAPKDEVLEFENPSAKSGAIKSNGWYIGGIGRNQWATYTDLELGRDRPFDTMSLWYAAPDDIAGADLEVYLDAPAPGPGYTAEDAAKGTLIGTFRLAGTGGWEKFQKITVPAAIATPGTHTVTIRLSRGEAPPTGAWGNLDRLQFVHAERP